MRKFILGSPPIYPILVALFLPLGLCYKYAEWISFSRVVPSLLAVVSLSVAVWAVLRLVCGNWRSTAFTAVGLLLGILAYGPVRDIGLREGILAPIWIVGFAALFILSVTKVKLGKIRFLTVSCNILMVGILLGQFVVIGIKENVAGVGWLDPPGYANLDTNALNGESSGPDIYLIIPDEYPGGGTLKEYFDYDNSAFIKKLEERDFQIVDSHSNYPWTGESLLSLLNLNYLEMDDDGKIQSVKSIRDYKVWRFLKERGYEFIHIGSNWGGSAQNPHADVNLHYTYPYVFHEFLLESSVFSLVSEYPTVTGFHGSLWTEVTAAQFGELSKVPEISTSTFTFIHCLGFHGPWILGQEGAGSTLDERRLAQLECMNGLILSAVDSILEKSSEPPIILILSDTGPYIPGTYMEIGTIELDPKVINMRLDNFQAFYLPALSKNERESFSSPVNTFRRIFNYYFDTDLEILPDRYYFPRIHTKSLIQLVDVTYLIDGSR